MTPFQIHAGRFLGMLATLAFVAGCGDNTRVATERPVPPVQTSEDAVFGSKVSLKPVGEPSVTIIPEKPTAADNLEAVVSGINGALIWQWERNGRVIEGATSSRLPKGSFVRDDQVTVTAQADGHEVKTSAKVVNSMPVVSSVTFVPARVWKGMDVTAVTKGVDADGDNVEYHYQWLINGQEVPVGDTSVLGGSRARRGDAISVRVTPSDGKEDGKPYLTLPLTITNAPPRFTSVPPLTFEAHIYSYQAVAEDPDGDDLSYSLIAAPQGMTVDGRSGKIEWKLAKDSAGTHTVEIAVKDVEGLQATQKFSLTISVPVEKAE